jgi:hypothetical protein
MEDARSVAESLILLIQQTPDSKVSGVQLAALIRHRFPNFSPVDYNCRNLRHFIAQYADQIQEVGRAGADIVYGLRPDQERAAAPIPREETTQPASCRSFRRLDPFVWRALTHPSSGFRVQANTETGELRRELAVHVPDPPWVTVPPVNEETHLQIARTFTAGLQDAQKRATLEGIMAQEQWWAKFFPTAMSLDVGIEWGAFRRRKLSEEIEKALATLRIPARASVRRGDMVQPSLHQLQATTSPSYLKGDEALRRIVVNVIKRLPSAELRALRLPVGDLLDAIKDE